ncbi:copper resistance protein CopZ [Alteribacter lacisalsi]|uniref:Copper chaperone CopZ n=1 Tax=Alteribacter lacisalsi TaxID=2045244 RepID=A0A2W0H8D7_9BACI|nr:copper chaperone CopZ [Alteribacter lacisalsi]PYZ98123.1 copper resistance protein CopZ [Alteribacter lacisalsi]
MKQETIKVDGMTCGHCKASVEGALNNLDGVKRAEVSLEEKQVTVEYDESSVDLATLKEEIDDQGFDAK